MTIKNIVNIIKNVISCFFVFFSFVLLLGNSNFIVLFIMSLLLLLNSVINSEFWKKKKLNMKYSFDNIKTGHQFELYLVDIFKDLNYEVKHTGKTGDQGCDLIIKKNNYIYAVQAKYYTNKLGNTPIQEVVASLKFYNANQGVVITNSSFTNAAVELAKANNVILINGKKLKKIINIASNNGDILNQL